MSHELELFQHLRHDHDFLQQQVITASVFRHRAADAEALLAVGAAVGGILPSA